MTKINEREREVLTALRDQGPMTADEYVSSGDLYVNSWAPTFTGLRKAGLVARTGDKRVTSHGSMAYVVAVTDAGRAALEQS